MSNLPYDAIENAVLAAYAFRRVRGWDAVMARLPGRTLQSAKRRLNLIRRDAGMLYLVPTRASYCEGARL